MVWKPGESGSTASQDYYQKAKKEYKPQKQAKQDIPSKKEWYQEKGDPSQHKFANENQRLIEKYAAKGKDFTKTDQYRQNMEYLENVTVNQGGNRGRIFRNDPTLNTGNKIGDAYRKSLLGIKQSARNIKDINPQTVRLGLENDPHQFFRFNQQLMEKNPAAYETARPISSGKAARDIIGLTGPGKILTELGTALGDVPEALGDVWDAGKEGLAKIFPGPAKDFGAEYKRLQSNFPWNRKKDKTDEVVTTTLDAITDPTISPQRVIETKEQEDIFNPMDVWDEGFDLSTSATGRLHEDQEFFDAYDRMSPTDKYKLHSTINERGGFTKPRTEGWEHVDEQGYGSGQKGPQWGDVDWKTIVEQAGFPEEIDTMRTSYSPDTDLQQTSELGLPADMGWQKDPYEKLSLDELINLGASQEQIADYLNISQAAGGGLASIDPYRGTMGGGMNPSGWSPDPTARSVTGYQNGGLMNNGNPVDYHNLRNTNKYYGSF